VLNDESAKKSGAEKWTRENLCSAISNGDFFALLFFAFLLVVAEGRAGFFASFVVPLSSTGRGRTTKTTKDTK
jgi:hypothetical protein